MAISCSLLGLLVVINGYWWLLMAISGYYIDSYWWLFYCGYWWILWLLVDIGGYYINGY
jgi:hypothetical protein